jgi:hypothetical protein
MARARCRRSSVILSSLRPAFDPRQTLSVVIHDLGPIRVSRCGADGIWVTTDERRRAMNVSVDGSEIIEMGLVLTADDELVAFNPCDSCELWECNRVEGCAAKVRRFGPYVFWITPWGPTYTFGQEQYAEVLGPGIDDLPELTADDAWELDEPDLEASYPGVDGRVLAVDGKRDPEGPLALLCEWPARGEGELRPVEPPAEAREIRATNDDCASIWVDVVPRADGSRAACLPGVMRVPVWYVGPAIDRAIEALVGPLTR